MQWCAGRPLTLRALRVCTWTFLPCGQLLLPWIVGGFLGLAALVCWIYALIGLCETLVEPPSTHHFCQRLPSSFEALQPLFQQGRVWEWIRTLDCGKRKGLEA